MAITFACPQCNQELSVKDEYAGKKGKCPHCKGVIPIPVPAAKAQALSNTGPIIAQLVPQTTAHHAPTALQPPNLPTLTPIAASAPSQPASLQSFDMQAMVQRRAQYEQQVFQQVMSGFQGSLELKPVSGSYTFGILVTTLFMLLIPLLYLVVMAWGFYGIYSNYTRPGPPGSGVGNIILYLFPVSIGALLFLFMIKPLFSRSAHEDRCTTLTPDTDPILFAFVNQICDVVGSPRPARILAECEVNASAGMAPGFMGLFSNEFTLRIGIPLVSGYSLDQFAGILAHEFGHFSQSVGMRVTRLCHRMNYWFLLVVYGRDSWDDWLDDLRTDSVFPIRPMAWCAAGIVWVTRKIMSGFLFVGNCVNGFMLHQMEYDADSFEARFYGSHRFESTCRQLRILGYSWQAAISDVGLSLREGRLPDNLPRLIEANLKQMPDDVKKTIGDEALKEKTSLFDSHPADGDRVKAAVALQAPGIFRTNLPARALFRDFDALSRHVTLDFYKSIFGDEFNLSRMIPIDSLLARQEAETTFQEARKRFCGGVFEGLRPLRFPATHLAQVEHLPPVQERLLAARIAIQQQLPGYRDAYEMYDAADTQYLRARQVQPLFQASIRPHPSTEGPNYTSGAQAMQGHNFALGELARLAQYLVPFENAIGERLYLDLCLLHYGPIMQRIPEAAAMQVQCSAVLQIVGLVATHLSSILELRNYYAAFAAMIGHLQGNERNHAFFSQLIDHSRKIREGIIYLRPLFSSIYYPFDHAKGPLSVSEYLLDQIPPEDEVTEIFDAGKDLIDNLLLLHGRCLGRLCQIGEKVEDALGLKPLDLPPDPKQPERPRANQQI